MEILAEQFIGYMKNHKQSSENTLMSYRHDLEAFSLYIRNHDINSLVCVNEATVRAYILFMHNMGKSDSSTL